MNDEDLVKAAQNGDDNAFYGLISAYKDNLYNVAYCYLKNQQDTLEAIQEVTYRAYLKINKLKEPKYFNTWLTRILINYCIDEQKRKQKIVSLEEEPSNYNDNHIDNLTIEDAIEKLERATNGKNYAMKIVIQTSDSGISRLFEFQTDVIILKSLELQTKDMMKKTSNV